MKKALERTGNVIYSYKDEKRINGAPDGITGDLSDCDITDEDRKKGIYVEELIDDN